MNKQTQKLPSWTQNIKKTNRESVTTGTINTGKYGGFGDIYKGFSQVWRIKEDASEEVMFKPK